MLADGMVGVAYTQTITGSGGTEPYVFGVTSGALPAELALTEAGVLSGTPTVDGPFAFTVRGTDANDCFGERSFMIAIAAAPPPNRAPVLGAVGDRTVAEGRLLAFTLTATDEDGDTLTYSSTALPAGATLNATTGAFSWTPGADQAGSYPITFTVTDDGTPNLTDIEAITVTVNNVISLPTPWVGSVSISSDRNVVAVGRPHIGAEVASYDGFAEGALTAYLPMLFKNAWGAYNAAFYVQNVHDADTANLTIKYYDSTGHLDCTATDTVAPLASKGYWVPGQTCLPDGWVGGVEVASDRPIVAIGRPHIGNEVMSYDSFSWGSLTSYLPMLFKNGFGGSYDSAFYVQNVHAGTATITMNFYDNVGALSCTKTDTVAPFASQGYWLPSETCLTDGWVGGVVVTANQPIVTVARPHVGNQITTYNGFAFGANTAYVPMLFNGAFGGAYNAAFYLQNASATTTANLVISYYDSAGTLSCTVNDTLSALASRGYWVPSQVCLPAGWVGGVVVTSDQPVVAVGRPHIGEQVTTYNGFPAGSMNYYLPMLFNAAFGGTYNAAFYIQNTETSAATVTTRFYDTNGALTCTRSDSIPARSNLGLWLPSLTCSQ